MDNQESSSEPNIFQSLYGTVESAMVNSSPFGSFEDIRVAEPPRFSNTIFGKVWNFRSLNWVQRLFLLTAAAVCLTSVGLTIERFATLDNKTDDYTFAIILYLESGFTFYYAMNGLFLERPYDLLVCFAGTITVVVYTVLNYSLSEQPPDEIKLARLCVALPLGLLLIATGLWVFYIYMKSPTLRMHSIGTRGDLVSAVKRLWFTLCLFTFDLQLSLSMVIFVLKSGLEFAYMEESIIMLVGLPFSVIWYLLGDRALIHESKLLAYVLFFLSWIEPAYVIYRFTSAYTESPILKASIITCGGCSLIVRILLLVFVVAACKNFGKGLKEHLFQGQPTWPNYANSTERNVLQVPGR